MFLLLGELILTHTAQGALEILGQILKLGARGNAAFGIALLLVVFLAAHVAHILHNSLPPLYFIIFLWSEAFLLPDFIIPFPIESETT